ncbi:DJ-1 family glyoxalase III [Xylanibacter muris]|uniref:DJ-1/PfpI family protein n=1 Tax=Xylanibacter muris TaxID=2736290 RepID=A0ABX2ANN4_9BACT|nr:DJ-1 family glyoxalase III [Xylanibacter muris]NPD91829.1 DJ-1/PfpI family protein [Xylanibacter muris]
MSKALVFMADGFEDIEALATVDILRRGGIDVTTVSITGHKDVESAHGVKITADATFEETDTGEATLLILPGGMPGAANLNAHEGLKKALIEHNRQNRMIAAICAAPMVLGGLGLLDGRRATCYPGFEQYLGSAAYTGELCTTDGNITTGEGPAATFPFAYALLEQLTDSDKTAQIADGMMFTHLMKTK